MSNVFKALADPTRRSVLQLLKQGPMSAGELAAHFDVTKPTMSAHFAVLLAADLIHAEKHGRFITYRLRMSVLEEALLGFTQAFDFQTASSPNPIANAKVEKP
jgi:DNA-binding transcriptional ArsR family regulator